jgi:hypothetical protein
MQDADSTDTWDIHRDHSRQEDREVEVEVVAVSLCKLLPNEMGQEGNEEDRRSLLSFLH